MAPRHLTAALDYLHRLIGRRGHPAQSDDELLEKFVARRDEAAFAALVQRHGPLVLGVCRNVLGDAHHAEDVFQAVFLVLARKAASVVKRESVGCWLSPLRIASACAAHVAAEEICTGTPPITAANSSASQAGKSLSHSAEQVIFASDDSPDDELTYGQVLTTLYEPEDNSGGNYGQR